MDTHTLIAIQISSLFPPTTSITSVVHTRRTDAPLPPTSDSEHATFSELFYHELTGSILQRVIHDGQVLELISLSTDASPIRFIFPAALLPNPALMWGPDGLHILAVTTIGSLFRLIIPISEGTPLWHATLPSVVRTREYSIQKLRGHGSSPLVHVQGLYCVTLGMQDGSILRLELEDFENEREDERWQESVLHHSSFFNSLTSFLHPSTPGGTQVISMASHPQPTDIGHICTLSRDRILRLWTSSGGCVSERAIPSIRNASLSSASSTGARPSALLQDGPQQLLRVFTPPWSELPHLLVFIPTEGSALSGGFFQLLDFTNDHFHHLRDIECSITSAHGHLRDFTMVENTLYTLWDRQGQSTVEKIDIYPTDLAEAWVHITYPSEPELTPAYLDELLLSPGSLADKFFEAVMRPGVFSSWTLHTAVTQYTDACLSIPGNPPATLLVSYATTAENIAAVVGCTVKLLKDPQTGTPLYDNYWNALKRDWEGFVARCREIERRARWPLAIGVGDPKGELFVIERERVGMVLIEDLPLRLHRLLSQPQHTPLEPQFSVLDVLWTLKSKLGPRAIFASETHVIDIARQEIAFPYADIVLDTAKRLDLKSETDDGLDSWIIGRLESIGSFEDRVYRFNDLIGGFDKDVKREEEEVELLLPPTNMEWSKALTATYIASSVNARYDLSLAMFTLLFYIPEHVLQCSPTVLGELFVVFRSLALLRYMIRQPAAHNSSQLRDANLDDEVLSKLRNMNVSTTRTRLEPSFSLLYQLLVEFGTSTGLPSAAHHSLDATGILQSVSPAHATRHEVLFCEKLRLLGYREAAREVLSWLPRTPAMSYVLLRVWLDDSRYEDAASAMESLAGSFGADSGLSQEDSEALAAVLPGAQLFDSHFTFYLHAASLFRAAGVVSYEVSFTRLALSCAPPGVNTMILWQTVIKGLTDLGLYDDAYTALIACPYERLKRDSAGQLVYRMCEEHAVDRLMTYPFAGLADEVEDALSFKARNADPRTRPFYSRILYTWYTLRGDYRNAALTMYQRARKLGNIINNNPEQFVRLAELQLEAYLVSINALSLVEPQSAWFVLPISAESGNEPRKRRKLARHIPKEKYSIGRRDDEVVELADIKYEFALLDAHLRLILKAPELLGSLELLRTPLSVVSKMAQANQFDEALAAARSLSVDMTDVFTQLTIQCLRLARHMDADIHEDPSDWLLTDKVSSWPGTVADRAWRYLRQALDRHDGAQTGFAYSKVTLETFLGYDRSAPPPPWLVHVLEEHHPEFLIRTYLRYEILEAALEHAAAMMKKDDVRLSQEQPRSSMSTWLPYTLIDQVLLAADSGDDLSLRAKELKEDLRTTISNRLKSAQRLTSQSKQAV